MRSLSAIVVFGFLLAPNLALKFLLYNPKNSPSHVGFMNKIADALLDAGHDVVSYMPAIDHEFGNRSNHRRARVIERECDFDTHGADRILQMRKTAWTQGASLLDMLKGMNQLGTLFATSCEHQLADTVLMNKLKSEKFDLAFSEFFDICGFGIIEKLGIPKHITLYSSALITKHAAIFGIPATPSYVPEFATSSLPPYNFFERSALLFNYLVGGTIFNEAFINRIGSVFPKYGIKTPAMEIMARGSYYFVNTDELADFPRPISHKKFQKVFDSAKSVVLVSFGSVASSADMPNGTKSAFLEMFSRFPDITFIWKYERPEDAIVKDRRNLFVDKWVPQAEIFAQEKLLLFITHGGQNSISEATFSGIPMVAIPLFGDQTRNSMMAKRKGFAEVIPRDEVTADRLIEAVGKVINDKRYKNKAKELSRMIAAKPVTAEERVVKYSEFAANFDVHTALDLPGRQLSTVAFYNLDVFAAAILALLIIGFVLFWFLRSLIRLFVNGKSKVE